MGLQNPNVGCHHTRPPHLLGCLHPLTEQDLPVPLAGRALPAARPTGLLMSAFLPLPDGNNGRNKCFPQNSTSLCGFEQPCVTHGPAEPGFRYSWLLRVRRAITSSQNRLSIRWADSVRNDSISIKNPPNPGEELLIQLTGSGQRQHEAAPARGSPGAGPPQPHSPGPQPTKPPPGLAPSGARRWG